MAPRIVSLSRRRSAMTDYSIALACGLFLGWFSALFV